MDSLLGITPQEIARNKIVEEHYDRIVKLCKGIASVKSLYYEDLTGPASEGLILAADAIVKQGMEPAEKRQAYINKSVRNAIRQFLRKEKNQGFTDVKRKEFPAARSIEEPISNDGKKTIENTVFSPHDFERDFLIQDEISKGLTELPAGYQEVIKLKIIDPLASNAELAVKSGKSLEAVNSIIRRTRKYFTKV